MTVQPGPLLVREVRIGLIRQGSSLRAWCADNRVSQAYISNVLRGRTNGDCAKEWRSRVVSEAKVSGVVDEGHRLNEAAA
ncbi:hypothetical protein [Brevundimonas sp.]|uniref:hypothetical protein n=1 Tax=Brevundimonas sp. TaxID=1871086 RepID=UPI003D6C9FAB